jgi:hypothetical protein
VNPPHRKEMARTSLQEDKACVVQYLDGVLA